MRTESTYLDNNFRLDEKKSRTFGTLWTDSNSVYYNLSEVDIKKQKAKNIFVMFRLHYLKWN